ncbi:MAG: DUF4491 family protein [Chloroflexia bacterium]
MPFGLEVQFAGILLAGVTFLTVWWGHVLVRIVHYYMGTRPAPALFLAGLLALLATTQTTSDLLAAVGGIVGLTLMWDAFELHRQELRVRQGHAPLNPRVHHEAAGITASTLAQASDDTDGVDLCLSCGSNSGNRFLCRRGPYCKVKQWEHYSAGSAADVGSG